MSLQEYRQYIASRATSLAPSGFNAKPINANAKAHQVAVLEFALNLGRSAAFLDTGLGKSFIELEFARQCADETGKPSLILTPLAVAGQMVREGQKFGVDARQIREQSEVGAGVMVANYERLAKIDPASFGAIILDESSILKSYAGRTRAMIQEAFKDTPYKLAATATPSPNDHTELGNHAEFLGVMRQQEMLSKWFINDTSTASQDWRLKGHAAADFWAFVASWSRCATLPSDLGGDDTGYILPPIDEHSHIIIADRMENVEQGMLFRIPEMSATSFHAEKKLTMKQRCEKVLQVAFEDFCYKLAEKLEDMGECLGSQNMQQHDAKNINLTHQSVIAESHNQEAQKKTQNTCENTTNQNLKNSSGAESNKTSTTRNAGKSMHQTQSLQQNAGNTPTQGQQRPEETPASNPHTEFCNLTMIECFQIRDFVAKFVEQSIKKPEARDFTSITATPMGTSEGCYAQRVTRLLERCVMMLIASEAQFDTLKKTVLDPVLVFCETNDEQDMLEDMARGICVSVRGSHDADRKDRDIMDWCDGLFPWLISKSSIVGFGMNFQHCATVIFASINFSYEKFYQAVRRVWRFGQGRTVRCHVVMSDTEASVWNITSGKKAKHDEMKRRMAEAMRAAQSNASVRVVYDRPLDLAFPEWIKGETK